MRLPIVICLLLLGALGMKTIEDVVMPRIEHGWDKVPERHAYCKQRSRKWYRKVTFQVQRTYHACMEDQI